MIPPASDQHKIAAVCRAIAAYLREREPWQSAVDELAGAGPEPCSSVVAAPGLWMDVTGSVADPDLARSLSEAASALCWRQNSNYTDESFLARYRYCELIGASGHALSSEYAIGLLYLAPHTLYPMHAHPAEESYHLLTGCSRWRTGDEDWRERMPGERILHSSAVPHAMHTDDAPLLAIYVWRGDVRTAARLAPGTVARLAPGTVARLAPGT